MMIDAAAIRRPLLAWYDAQARLLPWRVGPAERRAGVRPDPYRVWLSEVMLQQTTTPHAAPYFLEFTRRWPTVSALAAEEDAAVMSAWAGLGYYARARNLLACARAVADGHGGVFPDTEEGLRALPGVGAYTAAAVAAIAFDRAANVVDGNVERVMARLFAMETPLPDAKPELKALAGALVTGERPGDWAQALMDLGATVCRPKEPLCERCPVAASCLARLDRGARGLSQEGRQGRAPAPAGRGLGRDAEGRGRPGAPPGQGPARRHAGPADQRLAGSALHDSRGHGGAGRRRLAADGRDRARLHPLRPDPAGLADGGRGGFRRRDLDAAGRGRRGAAERVPEGAAERAGAAVNSCSLFTEELSGAA
jgi:A/G-specific adenine glycosylase